MVQVYVPAGEFLMGSEDSDADDDEKPQHTVNLDAYWMDRTEVTNEMFGRFVGETSYQTDAEKEGSANVCADGSCDETDGADWQHPQGPESNLNGLETHPVVQVSWDDATAYCEWAGRRLPTEAEWEKAARGTDGRKYPWGEQAPTGELANFCDANCAWSWADESVDDGYALTSPVGNYPAGATPYGAFDMAGNVWEWVNDFYDDNYYATSPRDNPPGASVEARRVLRGGSGSDGARNRRAPYRARGVARLNDLGFRCAASDF
jgi:serine/threonine-protein kinase